MIAIQIGRHVIGSGRRCFVIAEAGVNHNGRLDLALQLVDAAAKAGADAIKFQTFKTAALVTREAAKAAYQHTRDAADSQHGMLSALELSLADHRVIRDRCAEKAITFLSTPFDARSADELLALEVPAFKVSSGDLTNAPLLAHLASRGVPLIVSTGMATMAEVRAAVAVIRSPLALLHCVSCYPAAASDVNLRAMRTMADEFAVPIGYSDHTIGISIALAAVALGATILEKHLTLDRQLPGPDHMASLEPGEFASLVTGIRDVEAAQGHGRKEPAEAELEVARVARRSLVAAADIPAGTVITEDLIAIKRPGTGLAASFLPMLIGRVARVPIAADTLFTMEMLA